MNKSSGGGTTISHFEIFELKFAKKLENKEFNAFQTAEVRKRIRKKIIRLHVEVHSASRDGLDR